MKSKPVIGFSLLAMLLVAILILLPNSNETTVPDLSQPSDKAVEDSMAQPNQLEQKQLPNEPKLKPARTNHETKRQGHQETAIELLKDAASDGSIGAALELANLYSGVATPNFPADKMEQYAWLRIAQSMGDPWAMLMYRRFAFEGDEYSLAEQNYFYLLTEVNQLHLEKFGVPLQFNPRPIE